jgi:hypothetical protein
MLILNRERPSAAQPQPKIHKETRNPGICLKTLGFLVSWFPYEKTVRATSRIICAGKQKFHGW